MKTVLGINVCLSAIGWSLAERPSKPGETLAVTAAGVRVTTLSSAEKMAYNRGQSSYSMQERKEARSIRRMRGRYQLRREQLIETLREAGVIGPDDLLSEDGKDTTHETWRLRAIAVSEPITLQQLARVLLMINKTRGCSKKRLDDKSWVNEFHESGLPYGEFVYGKIQKGERVVGHRHLRDDRVAEFEAIWDCQSKYHPELTEQLRKRIRDRIIFYQREPRSKDGMIPYCQYESWEREIDCKDGKRIKRMGCKCAPRSSPAFQRLRIWIEVNNITIVHLPTGEVHALDREQTERLAEELEFRESMAPEEVVAFLYPHSAEDYHTEHQTILGNTTMARLSRFVPRETLAFDPLLPKDEYERQTSYRLWHLISSASASESDEPLVRNLMAVAGVDESTAREMASIRFEDGYGKLSHKAIRNILPFLLEGHRFGTALIAAGYRLTMPPRARFNTIPLLEQNVIMNPVCEKLVIQLTHIVNAVAAEKGKPKAIRVRFSMVTPAYVRKLTARMLRMMVTDTKVHSSTIDTPGYDDHLDLALSAAYMAAGKVDESVDFKALCKPALDAVLVSYKPRTRVATRNVNRIRIGGGQTLEQECLTPRGQIHKEQVYAVREVDGKTAFVIHKPAVGENLQPGQRRMTVPSRMGGVPIHVKHDKDGQVILDAEGKPIPTDYVTLRNNHHVAFYEDLDRKLCEVVVTFKEALERVVAGRPAVDREYMKMAGWGYEFSLSVNEMVVFPDKDFDPAKIDLQDRANYPLISPHLFRVQKISSKHYEFIHHLRGTLEKDPAKSGIDWLSLHSPKALKGAVKVRLNHIGEIVEVVEVFGKS